MKKILNISVIAALAILPMAANAAVTDAVPGPTVTEDTATAATATTDPKYGLVQGHETDANLATAGYVKGAYNAAIKAINKVSETADSAVQTVTAGSANGTISVDGGADVTIYDDSTLVNRVGALETNVGTLTNLNTTTKDSLVGAINEVNTAAGFAGTAAALTDTNFTANDKLSAAAAANAAMAAAQTGITNAATAQSAANAAQADADALEGRMDTAESDINTLETSVGTLTNLNTTTKDSLVGAINEMKTASDDYATKTGVLATINASTVPVMATWGSTTPTTVEVDAPANFVNQ